MSKNSEFEKEINEIRERYARRKSLPGNLYDPNLPYIIKTREEKEKALIRWMRECNITGPESKKLLEIGCGNGSNLLEFSKLGFNFSNLAGNELLEDRFSPARESLPGEVKLYKGNALELDIPQNSYDIVYQSMVFSSILNEDFKQELAVKMWNWVKPGGGILWYDFVYNNPKNNDVRGIPFREVKALFGRGKITKWKVTLAPPVSRLVTRINPSFYSVFNMFSLLRSHILCWILK